MMLFRSHRSTISVPLLCFVLLALFSGLTGILRAQTPAQSYDYDYIVALYERQEDDTALVEIDSFLLRYPDSVYRNFVRFMQAEIQYFKQDFSKAVPIFEELSRANLDLTTRADVYLHYATSLYYTGNSSLALDILERLTTELDLEHYRNQALIWKARSYAASGQINSALHYYAQAWKVFQEDDTLRYEYFMLLLASDKDEEAEALISENPHQSEQIYVQTLLDHYLDKAFFASFDKLITLYQFDANHSDPNLRLILAKSAFLRQDYTLSRQILNSVGFVNQAAVFLNAMLLVQDGKTAEADSLLAELVKSGNSDIAHKSWLERLKILFGSEPVEAIRQLNDFIQSKPNAPYQHERYYLAAFFAFLQEDYLQTLKWLNQSILTSQTRAQTERAEILSIEAWYRLGRLAEAASLSQRFIEQSPASEHLAKALYFSGLVAFETKDLELAQSQFKQLLALNSPLAQEAEFYLGEIEFFHANYNLALEHYQALIEKHGSSQLLLLRAAQSRYFIKDYTAARAWLDSIPAFQRDSDYYLLSGSILFNQRQYQTALYEYEQALSKATSDLMKTELSSYQALTLYQLGRFAEASRIYLSLSSLPESPDIYHYLAAKSAYQAGNYMQALDLYDSFLDLFPESDYILEVVSEIAKANYNLGNYMDALDDQISILQRFKTKTSFDEQELSLIRESLAGIELCLLRLEDMDSALRLAEMTDSFSSDYIRFELQYLLLKIYAEQDVWNGLLDTATTLRQAFPDTKRSEVELLMAEALIKLNRPSEADSLLSSFSSTDPKLLIKSGELDLLAGNPSSAYARFLKAWQMEPSPSLWTSILSSSKELGWVDFDSLLVLGNQLTAKSPESQILIMEHFFELGDIPASERIADSLLSQNINPWFHAKAYLQKARILFGAADYPAALAALNRLKLVFGDYHEIRTSANYLIILALLRSGARSEAEILLEQSQKELSSEQIHHIDMEFRTQP